MDTPKELDIELKKLKLIQTKLSIARKIQKLELIEKYEREEKEISDKILIIRKSIAYKLHHSLALLSTAGNMTGTVGFVTDVITKSLHVAIRTAETMSRLVSVIGYFVQVIATPLALIAIALGNALDLRHLYNNPKINQRKTRYAVGLFGIAGLGTGLALVFGLIAAPHFTLTCIFLGILASTIYKDAYFIHQTLPIIKAKEAELQFLEYEQKNASNNLLEADLSHEIESLKLTVYQAKIRVLVHSIMAFGVACLVASGFIAALFPPLGAAIAIVGALTVLGTVIANTILHYQHQSAVKKLEIDMIEKETKTLDPLLKPALLVDSTYSQIEQQLAAANAYINRPVPVNKKAIRNEHLQIAAARLFDNVEEEIPLLSPSSPPLTSSIEPLRQRVSH